MPTSNRDIALGLGLQPGTTPYRSLLRQLQRATAAPGRQQRPARAIERILPPDQAAAIREEARRKREAAKEDTPPPRGPVVRLLRVSVSDYRVTYGETGRRAGPTVADVTVWDHPDPAVERGRALDAWRETFAGLPPEYIELDERSQVTITRR